MTEQRRDDLLVFRFFNEIGIIAQLARNGFERVLPRAFQVTKGAMTNTLKRLERRGLIQVRRHPRVRPGQARRRHRR